MEGAGHDPKHVFLGYVHHSAPTSPPFTLISTPLPEHLVFAYLAQCRCDPAHTTTHFTHLVALVTALVNLRAGGLDELQAFIVQEKERYRFTIDEHARYAQMLGFGRDGDLGVELDSDVDDEFIARAWRSARQRAWMSAGDASQKRAQLNDALKVVAEQRGSAGLIRVWAEEKGSGMSPETAYTTLDVPREVDETMLLTVYSMRVCGAVFSFFCAGWAGRR